MVMTKQKLTKEDLFRMYYGEGKTLQDIGDSSNVTRERIRQLMRKYGIPCRQVNRIKHPHRNNYETVEDYFSAVGKRKEDCMTTIAKLVKKTSCSKCGATSNLVFHLKRYPAKSMDDLVVLCRVCHKAEHNPIMTYDKQLALYRRYIQGATWKEMESEFGISKSYVGKILIKIKRGYRTLRG